MLRHARLLIPLLLASVAHGSESPSRRDLAFGQAMQYGPAICSAVTFVKPANSNLPTWEGAVTRAITVDAGAQHNVCYDVDRGGVVAVWVGDMLDRTKTHHTSYKGALPPRPGASPKMLALGAETPPVTIYGETPDRVELRKHVIDRDGRVTLHFKYTQPKYRDSKEPTGRGTVSWSDTPAFRDGLLTRRLTGPPSGTTIAFLIAHVPDPDADAEIDGRYFRLEGTSEAYHGGILRNDQTHSLRLARSNAGTSIYVDRPGPVAEMPIDCTVAIDKGAADDIAAVQKRLAELSDQSKLAAIPQPWWDAEITTSGTLGADDAPYTVDTLTLPDYPFGSWMRLSAVGADADGSLYATTLAGDLWHVRFPNDLSTISWKRVATGLYEPLGLVVRENDVLVRGRDRITRFTKASLADEQFRTYENFHSAGDIGPGYHAFLFDLVEDNSGRLYFARSGRKAPTKGEVIRIDPDGGNRTVIARHFRHPNGMAAGGPNDLILIMDNPKGKFPSGGSIVREGRHYGEGGGPRTEPFLYLVPPAVDTSSGSGVWADESRFGPLSGLLMHTSYSKANCTYVMTQTEGVPIPNGFAVALPLAFPSGVMRACVNPRDGQLYVAGLRGWDSNSAQDGCLCRVRYTKQPAVMLTKCAATKDGLILTFSGDLDPDSVTEDTFYAEPVGKTAGEEVWIDAAELLTPRSIRILPEDYAAFDIVDDRATQKADDGQTRYRVPNPLAIEFSLKAADGTPVKQTVYCTINSLPRPIE